VRGGDQGCSRSRRLCWRRRGNRVSTCWTCKSSFAQCRRWVIRAGGPAMRSAGGPRPCTSFCDLSIAADNAIFSDRSVPRWEALMGGLWIKLSSREIVGPEKKSPGKFGIFVGNTIRSRRWEMGLVNSLFPFADLEKRRCQMGPRESSGTVRLAIRCLKGGLQCRCRRPGRHPGTRRECHVALLHDRGSKGISRRPARGEAENPMPRKYPWLPVS